MAIASNSETRVQNEVLASTAADVTPAIVNQAINKHCGVSVFTGKLSEAMFGPVALNGKARRFKTGESIEVRLQLAKNDTAGYLSSGFSDFSQDTQDTATTTRANWKLMGGTAIISGEEKRNNSGGGRPRSLDRRRQVPVELPTVR